jgi:cysteine desulfurase/selenocysteine lyase
MNNSVFNVARARRDFPILSLRVEGNPLIYLDNAATTQKPRAVIDKLSQCYKLSNANVHRGSHHLSNLATTQYENARQTLANFINASSYKELIWCKGTTEAINLVAQSLAKYWLNAGDTILVSTSEHHANIVPWQLVSQYCHSKVIEIPLTDDLNIDIQAYQQLLIEHRPKVVAIGHVSNATGIIHPIKALVAKAKEVGALTLIDGAQAIAHIDVDVQAIGCDFYCFSGHKCFGPTGIGALWGKEHILNRMPPWQGGGEMINKVSFAGTDFNTLPFKFEAGTPAIADSIAFAEAIDYLQQQDRQAIARHEQELFKSLHQGCSAITGVNVISPIDNNVGIVSFTVAGLHHQDIALLLNQNGIAVRSGHHCAMPLMQHLNIDGTLRASISFYNTQEEITAFITALAQVITLLKTENNEAQTQQQQGAHQISQDTGFIEQQWLCLSNLPVAEEVIQTLVNAKTWQQRFSYLLSLGQHLATPAPQLLDNEFRLQQCESGVWLRKQQNSTKIYYQVWSDAAIMRGLIVMLLCCQQQANSNIDSFLTNVKLSQFLSPSRTNGVRAIINKL